MSGNMTEALVRRQEQLVARAIEDAKAAVFDFVTGRVGADGRLVYHVHHCAGDNTYGPHPWKCDSSYCEVMNENCPHHGGPVPIQAGKEPWRGR